MRDERNGFLVDGEVYPVIYRIDASGEVAGWSLGEALPLWLAAGHDDIWLRRLAGAYRDGWRARGEAERAEG